jgi:hypothetical protein
MSQNENINHAEFYSNFNKILKDVPKNVIEDYSIIELPGDELPWHETKIELKIGDKISIFSKGKVYLFKSFDIWVEPHHHLWFRIGRDGNVFKGTRNTFTFKSKKSGKLFLANYPGGWKDKKGNITPADRKYYERLNVKGGMAVLIIKWLEEPEEGLKKLIELSDYEGLLKKEIIGLSEQIETPKGWTYLWSVGKAEIFQETSCDIKEKCISCQSKGNVGIIQKDANLTLDPKTTLRWSWKIDEFPSEKAENLLFNHDYLSIAVEFDNGQDITYLWSHELPKQTVYRCPIPSWTNRETHIVIRSGIEDLKKWIGEERNIYDDYKNAVGDPPQNIVKVWLIALTLFQRKEGKGYFADIELENKVKKLKVL